MLKYCLTTRAKNYQEADEIKVLYRDIDSLLDVLRDNPNIPIVQIIDGPIPSPLPQSSNLTLGFTDINYYTGAGLPWFIATPCESLYEANILKNLGACAITVGTSIFHDIESLAAMGLPLRMTPNLCSTLGIPKHEQDLSIGSWILPEHTKPYGDLSVDVIFEFFSHPERGNQEDVFYRIYAQKQSFKGPFNILCQDSSNEMLVHIIPPEVGEHRMNCGMACLKGGNCRICHSMSILAKKFMFEYRREQQNEP